VVMAHKFEKVEIESRSIKCVAAWFIVERGNNERPKLNKFQSQSGKLARRLAPPLADEPAKQTAFFRGLACRSIPFHRSQHI